VPNLSQKSLLTNLTLGSARRPVDEAVTTWLETRDAVDPTADTAEQLLAAYAISERLQRLSAGEKGEVKAEVAPAETRPYPGPRVGRALELILRGTYPAVLDEAVTRLTEKGQVLPPHLLPELLEESLKALPTDSGRSLRLLAIGGERANWLASQNPAWAELAPSYDLAAAWGKEATPGRRLVLLSRWRNTDPAAAREALATIWQQESPKNQETLLEALTVNLGPDDQAWLRDQLGPKRKGVRRELLRLLLLAGEDQAREELIELATTAFDDKGKLLTIMKPGPEYIELLQGYGGLQKGETVATLLLSLLPPATLPELTDRSFSNLWVTLNKEQMTAAARAIIAFPDKNAKTAFVKYGLRANAVQLPVRELATVTKNLPQEIFLEIMYELLTAEKNVLHYGGLPRLLALAREDVWSERISKAFVLQLVATLRDISQLPYKLQQDLQEHWRLCIPLLDPAIFGWARTQLHSMTERADVFGKLATEMLQTLAFRRVLRED
jgi:hypothetical protein